MSDHRYRDESRWVRRPVGVRRGQRFRLLVEGGQVVNFELFGLERVCEHQVIVGRGRREERSDALLAAWQFMRGLCEVVEDFLLPEHGCIDVLDNRLVGADIGVHFDGHFSVCFGGQVSVHFDGLVRERVRRVWSKGLDRLPCGTDGLVDGTGRYPVGEGRDLVERVVYRVADVVVYRVAHVVVYRVVDGDRDLVVDGGLVDRQQIGVRSPIGSYAIGEVGGRYLCVGVGGIGNGEPQRIVRAGVALPESVEAEAAGDEHRGGWLCRRFGFGAQRAQPRGGGVRGPVGIPAPPLRVPSSRGVEIVSLRLQPGVNRLGTRRRGSRHRRASASVGEVVVPVVPGTR